jgi:inhibitor of KinA
VALDIPVCYGGTFGPDLPGVAAWAGCTAEEVVAAHTQRSYRVFMLGFLPGFPYLAPVDDRIAMPRRDAPRPLVAAGSVGIAGRQTGIYPFDSPGGWQIIGRTPLTLFDPSHEPPALVAPGQRVQFRPISPSEFDAARTAGPRP